jgi:glycosyltransferase involved in cell wall biosynthesis
MKIAVGILCHNQEKYGRVDLFDQCLKSVQAAQPDHLVVMDNGSTDGTAERVAALVGGVAVDRIAGYPHGNTCGYGMNKLARTLAELDADVLVMSNDDIVWQSDAFDRLRTVWAEMSERAAIVSGLVEPTFALPNQRPWNEVLGVLDVADETLWVRRSVPGGAWSFRRDMVDAIFPVSTFPGVDDVPACHRLIENEYLVGAVDVAAHAGIESSTWNNGSHQLYVVETLEQMRERWLP